MIAVMIKNLSTSECREKAMDFDLCWMENKVTFFSFLFINGGPRAEPSHVFYVPNFDFYVLIYS